VLSSHGLSMGYCVLGCVPMHRINIDPVYKGLRRLLSPENRLFSGSSMVKLFVWCMVYPIVPGNPIYVGAHPFFLRKPNCWRVKSKLRHFHFTFIEFGPFSSGREVVSSDVRIASSWKSATRAVCRSETLNRRCVKFVVASGIVPRCF